MLNLNHNNKPDEFEYQTNISVDKRVFFDKTKVVDLMMFEGGLADTCKMLAIDSLFYGLGDGWSKLLDYGKFGGSDESKQYIFRYLKEVLGESRKYMLNIRDKKTKKKRESLDMSNVLIPIYNAGYAQEFLENFIEFRGHNKVSKDMAKRVRERFVKTEIDNIYSLGYDWVKAMTGRYYTYNDNIQNIPKLYLPCMRSISDDYLLVWGDLDQIDLRVAYYTILSESEEDDAIFKSCDDKYEAVARIIDKKLGRDFNLELFKDNRKKYKTGILARCYGQSLESLTRDVGDADFTRMLDRYYISNKRYMQFYQNADMMCRSYDTIEVYTYFGNCCPVDLTNESTSEGKLKSVLNCPIQSTSNDIIMHMVNKTVREFRDLGIGEDKFRVYMVRHDEPIFMIHKSVLAYLPIIRKNTVMQVDNWGPITMSLDIGTYYTVSEYDEYGHFFGDDDIHSGADLSTPTKKYNPFSFVMEDKGTEVALKGSVFYIDNMRYQLNSSKHLMFQAHNIMKDYARKNNITSATFTVKHDSDVIFRNINIDGITLYFNKGYVRDGSTLYSTNTKEEELPFL